MAQNEREEGLLFPNMKAGTPTLIRVLFIVGILAICLTVSVFLSKAFDTKETELALWAIGLGAVAALVLQIFCEFWMVIFRIYEELVSINAKLGAEEDRVVSFKQLRQPPSPPVAKGPSESKPLPPLGKDVFGNPLWR